MEHQLDCGTMGQCPVGRILVPQNPFWQPQSIERRKAAFIGDGRSALRTEVHPSTRAHDHVGAFAALFLVHGGVLDAALLAVWLAIDDTSSAFEANRLGSYEAQMLRIVHVVVGHGLPPSIYDEG